MDSTSSYIIRTCFGLQSAPVSVPVTCSHVMHVCVNTLGGNRRKNPNLEQARVWRVGLLGFSKTRTTETFFDLHCPTIKKIRIYEA